MMKKRLFSISLFLGLIFSGCAGTAGNVGDTITITGKVLVKGEAPRTFVAFKVSSRLYYNLVGNLTRVLRSSYQGKSITITGRVLSKAIGPGMPARLEVMKILEIVDRR